MFLEIRVIVEAPQIVNAINNLAKAINKDKVNIDVISEIVDTPSNVEDTSNIETPKYTVDQIMEAGAKLMDDGKANELIQLLKSFGIQAVVNLKPEQINIFAEEMKKLGAKL